MKNDSVKYIFDTRIYTNNTHLGNNMEFEYYLQFESVRAMTDYFVFK